MEGLPSASEFVLLYLTRVLVMLGKTRGIWPSLVLRRERRHVFLTSLDAWVIEALSDGEECSLVEAMGEQIWISCCPTQHLGPHPLSHRRVLLKWQKHPAEGWSKMMQALPTFWSPSRPSLTRGHCTAGSIVNCRRKNRLRRKCIYILFLGKFFISLKQ